MNCRLISVCHIHRDDANVFIIIDHAFNHGNDSVGLICRQHIQKKSCFIVDEHSPHLVNNMLLINTQNLWGNDGWSVSIQFFDVFIENTADSGNGISCFSGNVTERPDETVLLYLFYKPKGTLPPSEIDSKIWVKVLPQSRQVYRGTFT